MKIFITILIILNWLCGFSQDNFWSEDFGAGCNQGQLVSSYVSPNGSWSVSNTGANAASANNWYVSAMENGAGEGNCGEVCGNNRTLHLGSGPVLGLPADPGAAYYEGLADFCGFFPCGATSKRVESPTIDCSAYTDISLSFLYMEGGNIIDNARAWYFDGATWEVLSDMPKTALVCSPQGVWAAYSVALPASAGNNPDVRIGFEWINNDDGIASDPSFAVDDIVISGTSGAEPCVGDFNNDGIINTGDLLLLLSAFGTENQDLYDLNPNGTIGSDDLLEFLALFGTTC